MTKNQAKKIQRENNRQTKALSNVQVAEAVCGTSSIARFPLLIRLIPCYPDCRSALRSSTMPSPLASDNTKRAKQVRNPTMPQDSFSTVYQSEKEEKYIKK